MTTVALAMLSLLVQMPGMDHDHTHMHMSSHMKMTDLRPATPDDQKRAAAVLAQLRPAIEKYKDYHAALADGFVEFLPNVKQDVYHFTNWRYGFEAAFRFDPSRPTSLLYKKTSDGFQLVGAMYTAPKFFSEDQLNRRVPLSIARWHEHVNLCLPPKREAAQADWSKFGPAGSITDAQSCEANHGRFYPVLFGWMVHVYPFAQNPSAIWAH
ncbi:MAG TPA: hypothetical protein VFB14_12845 [Bryobacteraceae bacterium]|jgi:hypothetical protein|nr:hypothetical protein [Bryobacteraceae bacterium]